MIDLTAAPLWLVIVGPIVLFLAAVGAVFLGVVIVLGWKSLRPPTVVAPWADHNLTDERDVEPVPPVWRYAVAAESTPMCPPLPKADSLAWQFRGFGLDDPQRTGAWPIIKGFDELDLDEQLAEPKQLPGFEVTDADRKRFVQSDAQLAELADKATSKARRKSKPAGTKLTVDLGDLGKREVTV